MAETNRVGRIGWVPAEDAQEVNWLLTGLEEGVTENPQKTSSVSWSSPWPHSQVALPWGAWTESSRKDES